MKIGIELNLDLIVKSGFALKNLKFLEAQRELRSNPIASIIKLLFKIKLELRIKQTARLGFALKNHRFLEAQKELKFKSHYINY